MKWVISVVSCLMVISSADFALAQIKRQERKSLLNSDPSVIYLEEQGMEPLELKVVKAATVFSDKEGRHRIGALIPNQQVHLEALTDKVYRVRSVGNQNPVAGWAAPWAFSAGEDDFVDQLKRFYERQIQVQELIAAKQVALGMTSEEVSRSRGTPTKTQLRRTDKGETGRWEYIDYEEIKHYVMRYDPSSGRTYRVLSHVERIEKGKTIVELEDNVVSAVEESEDRGAMPTRVIVPPLFFRW